MRKNIYRGALTGFSLLIFILSNEAIATNNMNCQKTASGAIKCVAPGGGSSDSTAGLVGDINNGGIIWVEKLTRPAGCVLPSPEPITQEGIDEACRRALNPPPPESPLIDTSTLGLRESTLNKNPQDVFPTVLTSGGCILQEPVPATIERTLLRQICGSAQIQSYYRQWRTRYLIQAKYNIQCSKGGPDSSLESWLMIYRYSADTVPMGECDRLEIILGAESGMGGMNIGGSEVFFNQDFLNTMGKTPQWKDSMCIELVRQGSCITQKERWERMYNSKPGDRRCTIGDIYTQNCDNYTNTRKR